MRHGDELRSLTIEGILEGTRDQEEELGRNTLVKYLVQDAGVTSYMDLKNRLPQVRRIVLIMSKGHVEGS